jgi:hypothetical protein
MRTPFVTLEASQSHREQHNLDASSVTNNKNNTFAVNYL